MSRGAIPTAERRSTLRRRCAAGSRRASRPGSVAASDGGLLVCLLMIGTLAAGIATTAEAGARLRWRDGMAQGAPVPAAAAPQLSRRATGGVELVIEPAVGGELEVWVENPLFGPVEALVRSPDGGLQAEPALPARVRVPAQRRVLATRLAASPDHGARLPRLQLQAVAGDPGARAEDVDYRFPLQTDQAEISQGWGGAYSHREPEHRHALDLAAAEGTPVLAARAGVVMQVATTAARQRESAGDPAGGNAIRILHDDGSMALYAHLADAGLQVRPGQRVRRGDTIAHVGSTGYSTGPHLHFAVQLNRGLRLETLPFRMSGPRGVLRLQEAP